MKKRVICIVMVNIFALVCACFGIFSGLRGGNVILTPVKSVIKKIQPIISDIQKAYFFKKSGDVANGVLSQKNDVKSYATDKDAINDEKKPEYPEYNDEKKPEKPEYIEPEEPDINQGAIYSLPTGSSVAVGRIFFIKISLLNPQKDKIFSVTLNDSLYDEESIYMLNSKKFAIKSEDIYFDIQKNTYITELVLQVPPAMQAVIRKVEISEIQFFNSVITREDLQNNKGITNGLPTSFDIRVVGNFNEYDSIKNYLERVYIYDDRLEFSIQDENIHINVFIDGELFPRENMIRGNLIYYKDLPKPFAVGQLFQVFCTDNDGNIVNTVSFADRYVYELTLIKNVFDVESGKTIQSTYKQKVIDGFFHNSQLLAFETHWYTNLYDSKICYEGMFCILINFNKDTTLYGFDESVDTKYIKYTEM